MVPHARLTTKSVWKAADNMLKKCARLPSRARGSVYTGNHVYLSLQHSVDVDTTDCSWWRFRGQRLRGLQEQRDGHGKQQHMSSRGPHPPSLACGRQKCRPSMQTVVRWLANRFALCGWHVDPRRTVAASLHPPVFRHLFAPPRGPCPNHPPTNVLMVLRRTTSRKAQPDLVPLCLPMQTTQPCWRWSHTHWFQQ